MGQAMKGQLPRESIKQHREANEIKREKEVSSHAVSDDQILNTLTVTELVKLQPQRRKFDYQSGQTRTHTYQK